ncbi:NUDIX domain-containing protein [Streptomonospora nanhaiensis]|uniref:ADP-ribose pyrophosphatase YjhB (NUDIX family) n=1 Tax=Streptomonospora nanhaiensis TaxID=1323731 RepID=A0A853BNP3_9ACTN|nr:NUDIX domain-containing protein [Streptomonospora nanhaiensis]MBV2365935.1 NUDIX domain-containing protein [Streptomonospora nanhaiensis]MBX9387755.1 NUDIX domain-containing protein [Streptomonospora nanhaiensis]NYI96630.1 ADP-ribose pyrophosphatase YjhB (NUDIX family) [Streptomonospora nanhaiensis]
MATPDFILGLRKHVGHDLLWLTGVTAVVVADSGEVLLHRRADDGNWSTPGGILEPGEQPAAALVREVAEETGVAVVPERIASVVTEPPFTYPNGDQVQFIDITFRCRAVGGRARADGEESLEVAWFSRDALPPMNGRVLRRIRHAHDEGPAYYVAPHEDGPLPG